MRDGVTTRQEGKLAVVLAGHGVPATDCPPRLIGELMALQWGMGPQAGGHGHVAEATSPRVEELEAKIRDWPRDAHNDPYKVGLERLAALLKPLLPADLLEIGYNEFCSPSIPEALERVIGKGASRVLVISTMLTPGGVHSEVDVPRHIESVRKKHPGVRIDYLWPYDLNQVARLLAGQVQQAL